MDPIALFLGQVMVVLMMLGGMFLGDYVSHLMFGAISGRMKRLAYTLLFVVFLVVGGYLPSLLGAVDFYGAVVLQTAWGFSSVFASRLILFSAAFLFSALRGIRPAKKKRPSADLGYVVSRLQAAGLSIQDIEIVLAAALGCRKTASRLQKKVRRGGILSRARMNPCRLAAAAHRMGLGAEEITTLLSGSFSLSPEKAATVWRRST